MRYSIGWAPSAKSTGCVCISLVYVFACMYHVLHNKQLMRLCTHWCCTHITIVHTLPLYTHQALIPHTLSGTTLAHTHHFCTHTKLLCPTHSQAPYQLEVLKAAGDAESIGELICSRAVELDATMIIMGVHEKGAAVRFFVGSVTQHCVKHSLRYAVCGAGMGGDGIGWDVR